MYVKTLLYHTNHRNPKKLILSYWEAGQEAAYQNAISKNQRWKYLDRRGRCIWRESYQELYNTENPRNINILKSIPKCTNSEEEPCILREEVAKSIKQLKEVKAPGYDSITAEELKAAGDPGIDALHLLCERVWNTETILADWGKAVITITPIFKKKEKLHCKNRWISLLSHAGKIFTHIIQQRIRHKIEFILSEEQAGFRPGRGTVDQLFTLHQIIESYIEKGKELYVCCISWLRADEWVGHYAMVSLCCEAY